MENTFDFHGMPDRSGRTILSRKFLRIFMMTKLTLLLVIAFSLQVSAHAVAQRVTLQVKNAQLQDVMKEVYKQTGYSFLADKELLRRAKPVNIQLQEVSLETALKQIFADQGFGYEMADRIISAKADKKQMGLETKTLVMAFTEVRGRVVDSVGNPLEGASIRVINSRGQRTALQATSDRNGQFLLQNVPEDARLVISYAGHVTQTLRAAANLGQIVLQTATAAMEEVEVVVGYGAVRQRDLTGSVALVDVAEMQKQPAFNLDVALAGRASGVMVTKTSGAPGAEASIRIRGASSVFGINEPLYVIDGVPIQIGQGMGMDDYRSTKSFQISPLAAINPEDIERIDILKDASGTAIYGSRGANGVILVTTKRGKGGQKPSLSLNYQAMTEEFVKDFEMLTSQELFDVATEAYRNAATPMPTDFLQYQGVNTNWRELVTRNSYSDMLNLGLRGGLGNGNTNYAFSASMNNQAGVVKGSSIDRYNIRANMESEVVETVKVGANVNYAKNNSDGLSSTFYYNIATYRPDIPVFDANGRYASTIDSVQANPVAKTLYTNNLAGENLLASLFAEFNVANMLKFRSSLSYNQTDNITENYTPSFDPFEIRNGRRGSRKDINFTFNSLIFDNTITLDKFFGKNYINAMVGASYTADERSSMQIESVNFPDDFVLNNLGSAGSIQSYTTGGSVSGLESYFTRVNYNYDGRYYLTVTARADKSTKFGPNNQWGFFPSGAFAWRISEEPVLRDYDWISDLKFRASTGRTGAANLGDFLYSTFFSSGARNSFHDGKNGVILNTVPNPSVRWETTNQTDIGLDFSFFNNRIRGAVDLYWKYTNDLLLNVSIPFETGASSQIMNVGDVSNRGFEFVIGGDVVRREKFSYTTDFNFNRNVGRLEKLNGGSGSALNNFKEGDLLGSVFGYQVAGIFQTQDEITALNQESPTNVYQSARTAPGDFKYIDTNGDGYISASDIVKLGSAEPKFFGGWNNVLRYGDLETSILFYFSYGQKLQNGAKSSLGIYTTDKNYYRSVLDAWTPENPDTDHPRNVFRDPNNNARTSDYFVQDGSFLKVKNIQVAYYLNPAKWTRNQINQVKIHAGVSNLFILTDYDGVDPEVSTATGGGLIPGGFDSGAYPSTRTFNFGFNIIF